METTKDIVRLGGKFVPTVSDQQVRDADRRIAAGEVSVTGAAAELGITRQQLARRRRGLPPEAPGVGAPIKPAGNRKHGHPSHRDRARLKRELSPGIAGRPDAKPTVGRILDLTAPRPRERRATVYPPESFERRLDDNDYRRGRITEDEYLRRCGAIL